MKSKFKEYFQYGLIIMLVVSIKVFIIDVASVQGCSMYPTLNEQHDKVILEKYKQFKEDYSRGDIVVIKKNEIINKKIIKRIVGLPNETVEILNGYVYIDGKLLDEPYLDDTVKTYPNMKMTVPDNSIFVLGDNRENSRDSREIGAIEIDEVLGKAIYRFNFREELFNEL
jgi:signal peptidase I